LSNDDTSNEPGNASGDSIVLDSSDQNVTITNEATTEPEPVPLHDCDLCDDKFEACKHSTPVHIPPTPLVRGKAGLEDFYNKVNELVEIIREADVQIKKK